MMKNLVTHGLTMGAILLFALLMAAGVMGLISVISDIPKIHSSDRWEQTTGTMEYSGVGVIDVRRLSYFPQVRYRYTVEGREYVGDRYSIPWFVVAYPKEIEERVALYKNGEAVILYYDPLHPEHSALKKPAKDYFYSILFGFFSGGVIWIGFTALRGLWAVLQKMRTVSRLNGKNETDA